MNRFLIFGFGAAAFALASSASATGTLGLAGTFNAFVFNSVSLSGGGEAEGAIAVGGIGATPGSNILTSSSNYNTLITNHPASDGTLTNIGLYVNGNASFPSGGQLNNNGNAYIAGNFSAGSIFDLNGGTMDYGGTLSGTVQGGGGAHHVGGLVSGSLFTTEQTTLKSLSTRISNLTATPGILNSSDPNNWSLNIGSHASPTTYVVDMTASQVASLRTLALGSLSSNDTLYINISGPSVSDFGMSIQNPNGIQTRILWNYSGTGNFNVNSRQMEGSLLAPSATVNTQRVIEGNLIANVWTTSGGPEIHSYNFGGAAPAAVPEPCTMLALGAGAIGMFVRRRKK